MVAECPQCQMPVVEFQFADDVGEHYRCRCGCDWVEEEQVMAVYIFQTSSGPIEVRVSLDDVAKLINTVVGKTHWQLLTISVAPEEG